MKKDITQRLVFINGKLVGENLESEKKCGEQVKTFEFQTSKIATKIGTDSSFILGGYLT